MANYSNDKDNEFSLNKVEWSLLKEFIQDRLEEYPLSSKKRYHCYLNKFGKSIEYNDNFSKLDVLTYLNSIYFMNLSIYTQNGIKTGLRQFLKWLHREYDYIKNKRVKRKESKLSCLPTWDEIRQIITNLKRPLDKAIFMLFLESGATRKELHELNIGDITFNGKSASVFFKKSNHLAPRRVPLIESVPVLLKYLETHPFMNDPQAPLFVSLYRGSHKRLSSISFNDIIKRNTKSLNKNVYPYLLRQMRLKQLSRLVMPPVLETFAGWVRESKMSQYYYSPTDVDVENKILELYGIDADSEEETIQILGIKECPICHHINSGLDILCKKCTSKIEK